MHPDFDLAALRRRVGFGADDEALLRGLHDRLWPLESAQPAAGEGDEIARLAAQWRTKMASPRWDAARAADRRELAGRFEALGAGVLPILLAGHAVREALLEAVGPAGDELSRHEARAVERLVDLELALVVEGWEENHAERREREARMAQLGPISASIAHELRNPLGVIDSSVFLLRKHVQHDSRAAAHLERIAGQVRISTRIIDGLLEIVRGRPPGDIATEVAPVLESAREAVALPEGATLEVHAPQDGPLVHIDPHQLRQILVNLLTNAAEAAGPGGEVRVDTRGEPHALAIFVSDSGPGIDPDLGDRIFEPLVSSKPAGVGLGLALCRTLAVRYGGSIELGESVLGGATFVVRLPKVEHVG
ncbi:MAG TPA: ATP-binding protein [Vulgatibacter sp.]|nr:ATP-binding protein [Vulgatibacter sp.]